MLTEEDLVETALLRYAQQRATKWGADRFAAEFHRRDLEERWIVAARSGTTPYSVSADPTTLSETGMSGPVDAGAQEHMVGADRPEMRMVRPTFERHSSVPRPPAQERETTRRRLRRRERASSSRDADWLISPAEAARMSAAGRRLYGLDEPSDRNR